MKVTKGEYRRSPGPLCRLEAAWVVRVGYTQRGQEWNVWQTNRGRLWGRGPEPRRLEERCDLEPQLEDHRSNCGEAQRWRPKERGGLEPQLEDRRSNCGEAQGRRPKKRSVVEPQLEDLCHQVAVPPIRRAAAYPSHRNGRIFLPFGILVTPMYGVSWCDSENV